MLAVSGVVMDAWEAAGIVVCVGLLVSAWKDRRLR